MIILLLITFIISSVLLIYWYCYKNNNNVPIVLLGTNDMWQPLMQYLNTINISTKIIITDNIDNINYKCILVGWDEYGVMAQEFAYKHQELISKLYLFSCVLYEMHRPNIKYPIYILSVSNDNIVTSTEMTHLYATLTKIQPNIVMDIISSDDHLFVLNNPEYISKILLSNKLNKYKFDYF